jgi:glycosyltransferase involved in cell wall biosynthesis
MHILFLSHYFPPEVTPGANRTYEHVCRWVKERDVKVSVITNHPHHPYGVLYPGYANRLFTHERQDGIDLYRVKTYLAPSAGVARRGLNYLVYMGAAVAMATQIPRPDLVVATSPQFLCAVAGYLVSRLQRCPFIFELRDIWPDSIVTVGAMKQGLLIKAMERLELALYQKATAIIALTDAFRDYLLEKSISSSIIHVIKNGVDLEFFQPLTPSLPLKAAVGGQEKFIISYIGTVGMAHALDKVVAVAERLQDNHDILFLIIGEGAKKREIQELVAEKGLENIKVLPGVSKEEVRAYYALSDLVLVTLRNTPLFRKVIPSKIFEIMAMARPILCAVDGECRQIVEEAGSGVFVEPENVEEMTAAIRVLTQEPERLRGMGERGRRFVETSFDRDVLARQYLEILRELAGNHHPVTR